MRGATRRAAAVVIAGLVALGGSRVRHHRAAQERAAAADAHRHHRLDLARPRVDLPAAVRRGADQPGRREPHRHLPAGHARADGPQKPDRVRQETAPINPRDTAELRADLGTGRYTVHVTGSGIRAATLRVGRAAPERAERPVAAVDGRAPCVPRSGDAGPVAPLPGGGAGASRGRPPRSPRRPRRRRRRRCSRTSSSRTRGRPPGSAQLLQSDAGFVGAQPAFADLTGDGRMDAVVQVRMPGAAGTVAVFVFSSDGTRANRLRAVFRSQALYRATTRVARRHAHVTEPRWANGRRAVLPGATAPSRHATRWDARATRMRRRSSREPAACGAVHRARRATAAGA